MSGLRSITVRSLPGRPSQGLLIAGPRAIPVALGRAGIKANKFEGDGATPAGRFHPRRLWWRADRLPRPHSTLPIRQISAADAWCEDPADRRYNHPFRRSTQEPGDRLRRADGLYDVIVEIDHNTRPRVAGRGSAVFIHVAREGFGPTAGCVALPRAELLRLVAQLTRRTEINIHF
jgi:L,D-peptidoglycan transpeptidase YkuD (ErfK/YbiS/YcfS/YnhG family)